MFIISFETFRADVELGGLYNVNEIKILVCIILNKCGVPLGIDIISEIIRKDSLANYFDIVQAVSMLLNEKNINRDENDEFTLTESGAIVANELVTKIPYTVREKALKAAEVEVVRARRLKDNSVSIKNDDNGYKVIISMLEDGREFMGVSIRVATLAEANVVKENFLKDPTSLYLCNLKQLLGFDNELKGGR